MRSRRRPIEALSHAKGFGREGRCRNCLGFGQSRPFAAKLTWPHRKVRGPHGQVRGPRWPSCCQDRTILAPKQLRQKKSKGATWPHIGGAGQQGFPGSVRPPRAWARQLKKSGEGEDSAFFSPQQMDYIARRDTHIHNAHGFAGNQSDVEHAHWLSPLGRILPNGKTRGFVLSAKRSGGSGRPPIALANLGGLTKFCEKTLEWAEMGLTVSWLVLAPAAPQRGHGHVGRIGGKNEKTGTGSGQATVS
jgi:hypothetical protein